jgi:hypothetical protein
VLNFPSFSLSVISFAANFFALKIENEKLLLCLITYYESAIHTEFFELKTSMNIIYLISPKNVCLSIACLVSGTFRKGQCLGRYLTLQLFFFQYFRFKKKRKPHNHRPDLDDVIVILTDGVPNGKRNTISVTIIEAD